MGVLSSVTSGVFRSSCGHRHLLAAPSLSDSHVHYTPSRSVSLGCVTSVRPGERRLTFHEALALRLGVTLAEAIRLHQSGQVK